MRSPRDDRAGRADRGLLHRAPHPAVRCGGGSSATRGVSRLARICRICAATQQGHQLQRDRPDHQCGVGYVQPDLEKTLRGLSSSPSRQYTCGHFPQSFESRASAAGRSDAARQNSTYYGTIADIRSARSTPRPSVPSRPATTREATGPNLNQIMMGSEGTLAR
ncbi:MAG: hypothetical protein ACLTG4_04040 [Oscillospiraceae bacterium]